MQLYAYLGLAGFDRTADDVPCKFRLRNRPVDQIDRRNPYSFAELLELGDPAEMVETIAIPTEGGAPVEFLFGVDGQ
ncbi:hypothetical protein [Erythrobacter mangrovi]|uniref:hypothetical protein n=1 Tax=Erythrobacter mangrovi TaxID=2739433 RepID=UPI002D806B92|nr:hypothetical protein [Erythrobacter mangrovi]